MPSTNPTPQDVAQQARELLNADADCRVAAVRSIADAARAAAAAHSTAWAAAITAGWTDKSLRQLGLRPPTALAGSSTGRRRGRPQAEPDTEG